MTLVRELAILWLVAWGAVFIAIACLGLIRMPDLYSRLHAASKAASLGTALLGLALVLHFADPSVAVRAGALTLVVFVTAPLSAHLIARAGFVTRTPHGERYVIDETIDDETGRVVDPPPDLAGGGAQWGDRAR